MEGKTGLKNKSRFLILAIVFGLVFYTAAVSCAATDISGHWAQQTIEKWVAKGFVSGYLDGTFKPDQGVTRAEFTVMVNKAFDLQNTDATCSFSDVSPSDWFYKDVAVAAKSGYTAGYPDNTFQPEKNITRAEASVLVARAKKLATSDSEPVSFSDAGLIPDWAKGSISVMVAEKLISGYSDGTFKPQNPITRAESLVMIDNAAGTEPLEPAEPTEPGTGVAPDEPGASNGGENLAEPEPIVEPPSGPIQGGGEQSTVTASVDVAIGSGALNSFKTITVKPIDGLAGAAKYKISDGATTSAAKDLGVDIHYMTSKEKVTITVLAGDEITVLGTADLNVAEAVDGATVILLLPGA